MTPKVTVFTTVYNGMPYLKETIESALNQTYKDFVYLIVDDASPDPTVVECIESFDDPRIRFVRNSENLGTAETINKTLSLIDTPYAVRLDHDDVNLPRRVEEQIAYLENHPDVDIVCSWEHTIDSDGNKIKDCKTRVNNYGEFLGPVLLGLCPIWHPSIAFRTKAMIDAGGFKKEYTRAEDFEVTTRLALKRYGAAVIPKFHLLQREHHAQQSQQFSDKQAGVTRRIHSEAIGHFTSHAHTEDLAKFLRLESDLEGKKLDKQQILGISDALTSLLDGVTEKQKLSNDELRSLKKIIYKRAGFGVRCVSILKPIPDPLFYFFFYLLSPLQMRNLKNLLSSFYHNYLELRYKLK